LANSSASTTCSTSVRPAPPYSFGQETASIWFSPRVRRHCSRNCLALLLRQAAEAGPALGEVLAEEGAHPGAELLGLGG
jgi:hypothetical protein